MGKYKSKIFNSFGASYQRYNNAFYRMKNGLLYLSLLFIFFTNIASSENFINEDFIQKYENRLDSVREVKTDTHLLIRSILDLGNAIQHSDPMIALDLYKEALDIAMAHGEYVSDVYHYFGTSYRRLHMHNDALNYFVKIKNIAIETADTLMLAYALNDMGNIYYDQNELNIAFSLYLQAYELANICERAYKSKSVSINNMGLVLLKQDKVEEALEKFRKALIIRKEIFGGIHVARSHTYLARTHLYLRNYDSTIYYTDISSQVYLDEEAYTSYAYSNMNKAKALFRKGRVRESLEIYDEAVALTESKKNLNTAALIEYEKALKLVKLNRRHEAIQSLNKSIELARNVGDISTISLAYHELAEISRFQGHWQMAYDNMSNYVVYRDSLNERESRQKVLLHQFHYESQGIQSALELSEKDAELSEALFKREKLKSQVLYGILGLSGLFIFTMVYAYRNKINDNKLLKQSNTIIQKQHKEIQKGMEVLEAAKFRAEQSEKAKTEFLSKMSHEIRTPLNGIIGITELMQSEVQTDNIKEELKTIRISADSLLMIVNDILDYSKIEAGKVTFDRKKLDVGKVLKDTVRVLAYEADKKGIELSCEIDEGISADLSGDPFRLSQILYNLLSNAVKFTEQGSVKVKAKKLKTFNDIQSVKFEVSDTGIGISEADQETVFERFNQGNPQIFSKYGGTGLGLPITKSLIELQDGSLELKSTVGKGTTIKFILPFKIDKSLDTEPEGEDNNLVNNKNLNFTNFKVLIAEDNEINLKVLASILTRYQIDVTVAKNGLEAVEKFKSQRFDTIFMDIQMPEMDGIEATKIIREIEKEKKLKPIPILALTADVMFGTEKKAKDSGMDDVVSKPFIIDTIEKVLIRYLKP